MKRRGEEKRREIKISGGEPILEVLFLQPMWHIVSSVYPASFLFTHWNVSLISCLMCSTLTFTFLFQTLVASTELFLAVFIKWRAFRQNQRSILAKVLEIHRHAITCYIIDTG